MAATLDIKAWLTDLGIGGDDLALIETKLTPHADKIAAGQLRQSDYSREMDRIAGLQRDIQAKDDRLTAEAAEWAGMTAAEKAQNTDLRNSMHKLEQDKLALTQRLKTVATNAGVDPASVMEGLETTVTTPATPSATAAPAFDETKFVSRDQHGALAAMALRLPAQLAAISRQHRALTGEDVDEIAIIGEIEKRVATRGNQKSLDPVQVWEEMHGIPAKREAKAAADLDTRLAAAREEGRVQAISEQAIPGGRPQGRNAVVFQHANASGSKLQRPQPGSSISGAVSAFDSGKYRAKTA